MIYDCVLTPGVVRFFFRSSDDSVGSSTAKVLRLSKTSQAKADVAAAGGLKEFVLQVHGCPLTAETKNHLESFVQQISAKGGRKKETWIDIEGINPKNSSWQCFSCSQHCCFACSCGFKASERLVTESEASTGAGGSNHSSDMPFPCSHNGCSRFHANVHGFCQEHRWSGFSRRILSFLKTGWNWLQLLLLLLVQAAAEIQDRRLLIWILMSLLPAATLFLATDVDEVGWFPTCLSIPLFVGMVGSWIHTGKRFDSMQQAMLQLLVKTEAMYLGDLQATDEGSQRLLFEDFADTDLQQSVTDLRSNFREANRLRPLFQTAVCVPLSQLANRQVEAEVRFLTDCGISDSSVDVLYCKVFCTGLTQIHGAWQMLKGLSDTHDIQIASSQDNFARISSKKCCRVVLCIEGYFATVVLVDETIYQLEQGLDSMLHVANSLGLLDEAKPQHWASTVRTIATPHWCRVLTWVLRYAAQLLSALIGLCIYSAGNTEAMWGMGQFWGWAWAFPFIVLTIVFAYDLYLCLFIPCCCWMLLPCCSSRCKQQMQRRRLKPTQVLYRKHFGVQGDLYEIKVAILQLLTVLLQAKGKFSMLSLLVDGVEADLWSLHSFKCFIGLLGLNIMYPAMILAFPDAAVSRVGAACVDAALDLSYVVIWLVLLFQIKRATGFDNFAKHPLTLLGRLACQDLWSYMSVYFSVAHVCCVCRSLEQIDWPQLLRFRPYKRSVGQRLTRMVLAVAYALGLLLTLLQLLGLVDPDPCTPCRCSVIENGFEAMYRLESCSAAAKWNLQELNLGGRTGRTIIDISPDAFQGMTDFKVLDLSNNGLKELRPRVFQSVESLYYLNLQGNRLRTLPQGLFGNPTTLWKLNLSNNGLEVIEEGSFQGLELLNEMDLSNNSLSHLPSGIFRDVEPDCSYSYCGFFLDLSNNRLTSVDERTFANLKRLTGLNMAWNQLEVLPARTFQNFEHLQSLYLQGNRLRTLPQGLFRSLGSLKKLDLSNNILSTLPAGFFASQERIHEIDLSQNCLSIPPNELFRQLPCQAFENFTCRSH